MPQSYLYTVYEESWIPSTRTTCKKAKLDEVGYWRRIVGLTGWLNVWKRKKTNINITRWLSFSFFGQKWMSIYVFVSFSTVNGISYSSAFSFTAENENKMLFGLPLYTTKMSWSYSLSWNNLKSWSWSWSWTLGLVLVFVLKEF